MAEIPCVVTDMKEMSEYVRKNGIGIVCEGNTSDALIYAVRSMETFDFNAFHSRVETVKREYCWETQETVMIEGYKKLHQRN